MKKFYEFASYEGFQQLIAHNGEILWDSRTDRESAKQASDRLVRQGWKNEVPEMRGKNTTGHKFEEFWGK